MADRFKMAECWEWHSVDDEMNCPLCKNRMLYTDVPAERVTVAIIATGPNIHINRIPSCKRCLSSRSPSNGTEKMSVLDFMSKRTKVISEKQAEKIRNHLKQCFKEQAEEDQDLFTDHEKCCIVCRVLKENEIAARRRQEAEKLKREEMEKQKELERQQEIERQEMEKQKEMERQRELETQRQAQRREAYRQAKLDLYQQFHDKTLELFNDVAHRRKFLDEEYLFEKE